jgi:hypothetical protein
MKCPSQISHAKVGMLLGNYKRLHESIEQHDGEVAEVEESVLAYIMQWEHEEMTNTGVELKSEYWFPSEVFDIFDVMASGAIKEVAPTTYTVIFDEATQTESGSEVVYIMSTNCHRLKVTLKEDPAARPYCETQSDPLIAAGKQLAFFERGGIWVSTLAGSAKPYDHKELNRLKEVRGGDAIVFKLKHAHASRHTSTPLENKVSELSYPWGCAFDTTDGSLFVTNTGVPESSRQDDVLIELKTNGMAHVVAGGEQGYKNGKGTNAKLQNCDILQQQHTIQIDMQFTLPRMVTTAFAGMTLLRKKYFFSQAKKMPRRNGISGNIRVVSGMGLWKLLCFLCLKELLTLVTVSFTWQTVTITEFV